MRPELEYKHVLTACQWETLGMYHPWAAASSELRLHYGPGYRIYFVQHERVVFVLLSGGDKSSQKADIKKAKALADQLEN